MLLSRPSASTPRWFRQLEPRAKLLGMFGLIIALSLLRSLAELCLSALAILIFVLALRIPWQRLWKLWLGVPIFSLVIVLPATLNVVTPGAPLYTLARFAPQAHLGAWSLPETLSITIPGIVVAARFLLRVWGSVTLVLCLTATTEPVHLLKALRSLGMPKAFGMVLTMMHRYAALMLRAMHELHLARLSRTIEPGGVLREQRWAASGVARLFRRTRNLGEAVHLSMLARGFDGDLQVLAVPRMRFADAVWLAVCLLTLASAIFGVLP